MRVIAAPSHSVYRVAANHGGGLEEVFYPPPWFTSFRGRWDDPRINDPNRSLLKRECFRVLYFSTQLAGAFGETFQRHIPKPAKMQRLFGGNPPTDPHLLGGQVKVAEVTNHRIGATLLSPTLRFVDVMALQTRTELYHGDATIAPLVQNLGLKFLDISAITGATNKHRRLTQQIALSVHSHLDNQGGQLFHGVRYQSHVDPQWECWALFHECLLHKPLSVTEVVPDDPALLAALHAMNIRQIT